MAKLPDSITLVFNGTSSRFDVKAVIDDRLEGGREVGLEIPLGRVEYDEDDESWDLIYGPRSREGEGNVVGGLDGPFEALGQLLDSVYDLERGEGDSEEPDAEEVSGRRWALISKSGDCDVHAMQINRGSTDEPFALVGCLVRTEIWDDDNYSTSTQFIPGVALDDLRIPAFAEDADDKTDNEDEDPDA